MSVRLFVAVNLTEQLREKLYSVRSRIERIAESGIRFVNRNNLHITLKFLGDVEEADIEYTTEELSRVTATCAPFQLKLGELGIFPEGGPPRVLWCGLAEGEQSIKAVAIDCDTALARIGFEIEERNFHSHITLGRIKGRMDRNFRDKIYAMSVPTAQQTVSSFELMRSELSSAGPTYQRVQTFQFPPEHTV